MRRLFLALLMVASLVVSGCSSNAATTSASDIPSGNDCAENIAYLQAGVNKYKEALGNYPSDVQKLLETKDGKGPFVEVIPECPGGNQYLIQNGTVVEAPRQ